MKWISGVLLLSLVAFFLFFSFFGVGGGKVLVTEVEAVLFIGSEVGGVGGGDLRLGVRNLRAGLRVEGSNEGSEASCEASQVL